MYINTYYPKLNLLIYFLLVPQIRIAFKVCILVARNCSNLSFSMLDIDVNLSNWLKYFTWLLNIKVKDTGISLAKLRNYIQVYLAYGMANWF